jgi:two-component system, OmpR family, response regulator ArlR
MHILIVEDKLELSKALAAHLTKTGYKVTTAFDGKNGLDLALHTKPDLILLDILMPELNGLEVLKRLREDDAYGKKVPVILLTNKGDANDILKGIKQQVTAYFIKAEVSLEVLTQTIKEALHQ